MPYNHNFFRHARAVKEVASQLQLTSRIDVKSLKLNLRGKGRSVDMLPQFVCRINGRLSYTPSLRAASAIGFLGWRPYFNRVWPLAVEKMKFKEYCREHDLPSPRVFASAAAVDVDVLIKKSRSSFGQGIIGPMTPQALSQSEYSLGEGEYFEEFVLGDIAKIWYWNDRVACVSLDPMPAVIGDGSSTLRQLIVRMREKVSLEGPIDVAMWDGVARYQGLTLDAIVPSSREVFVDFRYQSPLHPPVFGDNNALTRLRGTPIEKQLDAIGASLWNAIPEEVRFNTLFTVDAIIDRKQQVVLLEMNCNPLVQADVYRPMIESLFNSVQPSLAGVR